MQMEAMDIVNADCLAYYTTHDVLTDPHLYAPRLNDLPVAPVLRVARSGPKGTGVHVPGGYSAILTRRGRLGIILWRRPMVFFLLRGS